jgi:hypothetical protein
MVNKLYKMSDGAEFLAKDSDDLVKQIRYSSFIPELNEQDYMKSFAKRVEILKNIKIRYDISQNFLDDLLECGIITLVKTT